MNSRIVLLLAVMGNWDDDELRTASRRETQQKSKDMHAQPIAHEETWRISTV